MIIRGELLFGVFIYLRGFMILVFQWKHLLNILLGFEIIILSIIFTFLITWGLCRRDYSLMIIIVVFGVCEARLGLSLLVSLIRAHGNDYVRSLRLHKL